MSDAERLRAELEVAELEEALIEAKKGRKKSEFDDPDYRDLKLELREARRVFRELRDADAPASPATVTAKARSK